MSNPEDDSGPDESAWEDIGHQIRTQNAQTDRSRIQSPPPQKPPEYDPCSVCGHVVRPFYNQCPKCEGIRNREKVEHLAEIIRALLKGVSDPELERRLVKEIWELHPFPKEFLEAVAGRRKKEQERRF